MQGVTLRLVISTTTLLPARTKNRGRLSAVVPALRDFVQQLWSLQSHIASVSLATGSKIRASARTNTLFYVPTRLRPHCERDRACRSLRRTTVSTVAGRNIAKFDRELHLMYVPPLRIVSLFIADTSPVVAIFAGVHLLRCLYPSALVKPRHIPSFLRRSTSLLDTTTVAPLPLFLRRVASLPGHCPDESPRDPRIASHPKRKICALVAHPLDNRAMWEILSIRVVWTATISLGSLSR